jgi:hypothetical protein
MRRLEIAFALMLAFGGCTNEAPKVPDSNNDRVSRAIYRHDGPPELTLLTMINNETGAGAHTAMVVNGSQRVLWDPAGSFRNERIVERGDVVFGATPLVVDSFTRFHTRETHHVVVQTMRVSTETAEAVLQRMLVAGNQLPANCTRSTASILAGVPEFNQIKSSWFPNRLMEQWGQIPGVSTRRLYETDDPDRFKALAALVPSLQSF